MSEKKVYDYVVVLKNKSKATIEKTGWMLSALSILPIGISIYQEPDSFLTSIFLFGVISLLISLYIDKKKKKELQFRYILICIGIGLVSISGNTLMGILFIFAGISEIFLSKKVEIGFSENHIIKKGIRADLFQWDAFNNIMIKDGLLTMDFKNNKIIQAYTDDDVNDEYDVGEDEFNAYCKKHLGVGS